MWEHKGFKIVVNNDGNFVAESADDHFEALSLDQVKHLIDKSASKSLKKRPIALHVILLLGDAANQRGFSSPAHYIESITATITGFNRTSRNYTGIELPPNRHVIDVIPDTEFNRQLVIRVLKAREEWACVEKALQARLIGAKVDTYNVIEPDQYERFLQRIEEKYAKALAESDKPGLLVTQIG
jgi:hypothetical protein